MRKSVPGQPLVVGLGEALFDCFGERQVLGGAPLNFAVHARQLLGTAGGGAAMATRVGDDDLGRRGLRELAERGVATAAVQVDAERPTGTVDVTLDGTGQPTFEIVEGVAWDRMAWTPELAELAAKCDAVCFGTLAQRREMSRETIRQFLAAAPRAMRLYDVNLRPPYTNRAWIEASLRAATAVKCNRDELVELATMAGVEERGETLRRRYGWQWLAVTDGARGTTLYFDGGEYSGPPDDDLLKLAEPRDAQADSVGAGDSCGAALAVGMLRGLPPGEVVRLANAAGAFVASRQGATPVLPNTLVARFGR